MICFQARAELYGEEFVKFKDPYGDYRGTARKIGNKGGENELYKIAKQRNRQSKIVQQVRVIKSKTGEMLMEKEKVKQRWKEYFDNSLNQENPRERRMRTEEREKDLENIS